MIISNGIDIFIQYIKLLKVAVIQMACNEYVSSSCVWENIMIPPLNPMPVTLEGGATFLTLQVLH